MSQMNGRIRFSREWNNVMSQANKIDPPPAQNWAPQTDDEREAVRAQLERILASHLFKNSKRYPKLLRYLVEHTLDDAGQQLKERVLGVEVFGRDPDYDTNLDPVVRIIAGEVRKRLAQYYHEPGRESEILIDLHPGSYVPVFRAPAAKLPYTAVVSQPKPRRTIYLIAATLVAITVGVSSMKSWTSHRTIDQFWEPVLKSSGSVLLCIGPSALAQPDQRQSTPRPIVPSGAQSAAKAGDTDSPAWSASESVSFADATTLARLSGLLEGKGKSYRIERGDWATLRDMRGGPIVLIGAFNNDWTLRLTGNLRFRFAKDAKSEVFWIEDQQNPDRKDWAVTMDSSYPNQSEDYAVVSRMFDPTTQQTVVVAAGIGTEGTVAAGEFLSNAAYLEALIRQAPTDWENKNLEVIISTQVINGQSGPPKILASHFW
jgi:hypothetical protein